MSHRNEESGAEFAADCCIVAIMLIVTIMLAVKASDRQAKIDADKTAAFVGQMDPETRRIVGGGK